MTGWGAYVTVTHPPAAQELAVKAAFERVQAGELAVIDATAAVAASPTNTAPADAAKAALAAAQNDLLSLLNSITNNPH